MGLYGREPTNRVRVRICLWGKFGFVASVGLKQEKSKNGQKNFHARDALNKNYTTLSFSCTPDASLPKHDDLDKTRNPQSSVFGMNPQKIANLWLSLGASFVRKQSAIWVCSILATVGTASAQTPDYKWIGFHVTSVESGAAPDLCDAQAGATCTATRIRVEGYRYIVRGQRSTEFVLRCDEIWAQEPSLHQTIACVHLHANEDYAAKLFDDSISFLDENKPRPKSAPLVSNYDIVSEREVNSSHK